MTNLTIKDLPERIHKELKNAARSQGRSLNRYVVSLLELSVEERFRRKMMRAGRDEFRKFLSKLPRMSDSIKLIREDRDRGHR
jgi:plasmid stability protein